MATDLTDAPERELVDQRSRAVVAALEVLLTGGSMLEAIAAADSIYPPLPTQAVPA